MGPRVRLGLRVRRAIRRTSSARSADGRAGRRVRQGRRHRRRERTRSIRARSTCKSFAFGGKNTAGGAAVAAAPRARRTFANVRFAKLYDSASPKLMLRDRVGPAHPVGDVHVRAPRRGRGATFLTYKLTDVVVAGYEQGGTRSRPLLEHVELSASRRCRSATRAAPAALTWANASVSDCRGAAAAASSRNAVAVGEQHQRRNSGSPGSSTRSIWAFWSLPA